MWLTMNEFNPFSSWGIVVQTHRLCFCISELQQYKNKINNVVINGNNIQLDPKIFLSSHNRSRRKILARSITHVYTLLNPHNWPFALCYARAAVLTETDTK